jgi:cytochrome c biogenesis protein ResB
MRSLLPMLRDFFSTLTICPVFSWWFYCITHCFSSIWICIWHTQSAWHIHRVTDRTAGRRMRRSQPLQINLDPHSRAFSYGFWCVCVLYGAEIEIFIKRTKNGGQIM